ncbi:unnamed protein product [Ixodes pacificus]
MSSMNSPLKRQEFLIRDPRTQDWPVSGNVTFISVLLVSYVYIVKVAGPRLMTGRSPMQNLRPLIMFHNAFMILANLYFIYQIGRRSYFGGDFDWMCQGLDYNCRSPVNLEILSLHWWYLWIRVADFLDTVFFVLRKKDTHVSLLHVSHHVLVVFSGWFGITYGSDGQAVFAVLLNSFVHVVMYGYYFLSLLGPSVRKYLWWKRYLTLLQLAQFVIIFLHAIVPFFVDCGYPTAHLTLVLFQVVFYFVMFARFYVQAYRDNKAKLKTT